MVEARVGCRWFEESRELIQEYIYETLRIVRLWKWTMDGRRVGFRSIGRAPGVGLAMLEREKCGTGVAGRRRINLGSMSGTDLTELTG